MFIHSMNAQSVLASLALPRWAQRGAGCKKENEKKREILGDGLLHVTDLSIYLRLLKAPEFNDGLGSTCSFREAGRLGFSRTIGECS